MQYGKRRFAISLLLQCFSNPCFVQVDTTLDCMVNPFPNNPITTLRIDSVFNPLPDDKILDQSKLKQIADDILKCS